MSTRIKLWFVSILDKALSSKLSEQAKSIRLFCSVRFKSREGWTDRIDAIVDSGAPYSIIPLDLWQDLDLELEAEHEIHGINPTEECKIPVKVGKIKCILVDNEGNRSRELPARVYLASSNLIPLLIGFNGILEKFKVYFDYIANEAYLELK